ncbi:MAG: hypothetical protein JO128_05895 [Alphaproteobacteria bacterium]|nr:hypothetical protein [Alphaproteobacteria bacterium]
MGTAKVELADDNAAYFSDMARHYQALAVAEQHERQSDLFATIAADYGELAAAAGQPQHSVAVEAGAVARWRLWVGRWRRPTSAPLAAQLAAPLPLPAEPTPAK